MARVPLIPGMETQLPSDSKYAPSSAKGMMTNAHKIVCHIGIGEYAAITKTKTTPKIPRTTTFANLESGDLDAVTCPLTIVAIEPKINDATCPRVVFTLSTPIRANSRTPPKRVRTTSATKPRKIAFGYRFI